MNVEIRSRFTGAIMVSGEAESLRIFLESQIKSGVDLRGAYLSGADLRGVDLGEANLIEANLGGVDLSGADLHGADLSGAYLSGAYLRGADLSGAYLSEANLSGAYLSGVDLRGVGLRGVDLSGANLNGAWLDKDNKISIIGDRSVIQISPIGSRSDTLLGFITTKGVYVRTGCFFGALAEFEARVKATHERTTHGYEYAAAIDMIRAHARLWTPAGEKEER